MADHPRSAFHCLNSVLKSLVRQINSSGDIVMYRFRVLAWNCLGRGVLWAYFPHHRPEPPKGPSLSGNTFESFSVRISATVRAGHVSKQNKYSITKKSQKCYIPLFGGKPLINRFGPKVTWWVMSTTLSPVPSFKLKSLLVTILQGSNFWVSCWFLHGPYNSAALMRCLWCNVEYLLPVIRWKCLFCLHHCKISWFCQYSHSTCQCQKHKRRMST